MWPRSPDYLSPAVIDPADLRACRALLAGGSRTFFAASLLLPRRVRDPASALYAFCRLADDLIDRERDAAGLERLSARLDGIYAGRPGPAAADRALAAVVAHHGIPRPLLDALLEGFRWDAEGRRYETAADLEAYAVRVAGAVGILMALLMGVRDAPALARAADLGIAMQLSNIARDVGEDAGMGRLYLPLAWLREAGIDPDAWLARPAFDPALGAVVRRLLDAADRFYRRADAGIAALPRGCRPGIRAARLLYAGIGDEVARRGHDSVGGRASVPTARKLALVGRALLPGRRDDAAAAVPSAAAARELVEVAAASGRTPWARPRSLDERVAWVVDLFQRLERRERA